MIQYVLEPFSNVAEDVAKRIGAHFAENKSYGKPDLDWLYYLQASDAGQCKSITVKKDGKVIGYSVFFISNDPDRKNVIQAVNSGIFLDKEHRGKASIDLLKKSDELLKGIGVHEVNYLIKDDRLGRLLARNGYDLEYKLWSNKL